MRSGPIVEPASLNIVHVVDSLERGGMERVVVDLATAQLATGHTVRVFSINQTEGLLPELRDAGVDVIVGGKRRSFDIAVLRRLRRLVMAARADVVHAHNFSPAYYAAVALLGLRGPVLVATCHDMGTRLVDPKLRLYYRFALTRTRLVAMVSRQVRDRYLESGLVDAARARTIINGIPVERFRASPERRRAARRALGVDEATPVIGCVGRLVPIKNHRLLLDAMPALVAAYPRLCLVLVGTGGLEHVLREQVAALGLDGHVRFAGERGDVAALLPSFDIFALTSLSEGLSIALLEACAAGLAIVATAVGGNPQIITPEVTGLLVPSDDVDSLRRALADLLDDPARRARLGTAAAEWAGANASMQAFVAGYERFYRDALGLAPAAP